MKGKQKVCADEKTGKDVRAENTATPEDRKDPPASPHAHARRIGCRMTVFHFSGGTFRASER